MWFVVKFRDGKSPSTDKYPHTVLVQDNWDDYSYKTTFHATIHLSPDNEVELGSVKILKEDQTHGLTPVPRRAFRALGEKFCSLGADLEYYEKLFKLGAAVYEGYLEGLQDVAYSDSVRAQFEDHEGFKVSLLRFSGAERTIVDASRLFTRKTPTIRRRGRGFVMRFKTQVARQATPLIVDFDFRRKGPLPNRINVLIGYNGTGKTRMLANLATVASGYGYSEKRDFLEKRAGRFVGTQPPFKSVVVVSYSAFDTFAIPGKTNIEKRRLENEGGIFGYVYCGLRERIDVNDDEAYRLKNLEEVDQEFLSALERIRSSDRMSILLDVLKPLLQDVSFQRIGLTTLYADKNEESLLDLYHGLSSGHKIVTKMMTELTAHLDDAHPTLVLIDEPETHLHPPLLATVLKSIRICLDHFDGYAIISTHSPVVLQETPSKYVLVLKRIGELSKVVAPSIETFGENISVITEEVFNLDDGSTDWHDTLQSLARSHNVEEIEDMFGRRLGFGARSYMVNIVEEDL
ncbi:MULTISPECIES: AAA family ATPase [Pseudomonas]|uniref:AAA family ATPase n=1 Tax=Pseudomonas TaxID=286 RepID=UPI0005BB0FF0|nr:MULTISPECIES: AAA family ATPase [Pseudomonas]MBM2598258.1 AAA family ATPase [Pseudomonas sp. BDPW]MDV7945353.1 AAA family ATPase [Pseudomonas aeruginosa]HBO6759008.1 AAA family ATPase [Pseudomonas aeruginosa]HBO7143718.1 AAA family ATPase [Pseudomonas aeruginosa]HEP8366926.1 AAA family ATPase [Pseudomonas aeruginosa]